MKRIYLSGPMSGMPELNYPAFHHAARTLRDMGFEVENPADIPPPNDAPTWGDWMRKALSMMLECDAVAMLPGWERSLGAREERRVAFEVVGMPCFTLAEWLAGEAEA
jgi:hypothetical protein